MRNFRLLLAPLFLLFLPQTITPSCCGLDFCDLSYKVEVGPTFEYTRFYQGCLPHQSGMMIGPVGAIDIEHDCGLDWYMRFKGLYEIPYICSENGIMIDAREYEVNGHLGYNFINQDCCFSIMPFTGIDFIYLRHTVKPCVIRNRYYQINVPFGVEFLYQLNDCVQWGIKLYYDLDVWNRLKVCTPNVTNTSETKIELHRGDRVSLEMPLNWDFTICDCCCSLNYTFLFNWQKFECAECPTNLNIPVLKKWHVGSIITFGLEF